MMIRFSISRRSMLLILHPVFALTAVADAITGPMLPSLARSFHLSDSESGLLFFYIFSGMAIGALLCRGNYARVLMSGLFALTVACFCFPWISRPVLHPFAFFFGASVGAPMTAVSLFAGRNYPIRRASVLTVLNFSWSAGAMLAPLMVARLIAVSSWRTAFIVLACAAGLATLVVSTTIRDTNETARETLETKGLLNLRLIVVFALFFLLEVGMETMFGAWISTYVLRVTGTSFALAAAATAIYWTGFLVSRGLSSLLLIHVSPGHLLWLSVPVALGASVLLIESHSPRSLTLAILLLGIALAPIFPVGLAAFFDRARHSSDTRFVLALSGIGASFFPWLVGWVSFGAASLRSGLVVGPMTLLVMTALLPFIAVRKAAPAAVRDSSDANPRKV
jgi:fucose permease